VASVSTRICPVCGSDYLDWVETCSTCGVLLVVPAQAPDPLRLPVDQQVVYELGEWPLGMQASAAQVMAESGIPHGWDGTDLVVQLDHEATVDALLEAVEAERPGIVGADWLDEDEEAAGTVPASAGWQGAEVTAEGPSERDAAGEDVGRDTDVDSGDKDSGDEDGGDELEYELDEWPDDDRAELSRRLAEADLPYRWEDDAVLVVRGLDETFVEELLDELEFPDALASEEQDEADETSFELMSELFVAADRLKGNPRDPDGILGLATVVEAADPERPPYGVEPVLWQQAVVAANDLADRLAGGGDDDGDGFVDDVVDEEGEPVHTDDDLVARAGALRNLLRPFV
jgi:hypothetical protein